MSEASPNLLVDPEIELAEYSSPSTVPVRHQTFLEKAGGWFMWVIAILTVAAGVVMFLQWVFSKRTR